MIKAYYGLASDSIPENILRKLVVVAERYIGFIYYDDIVKESLQRPSDIDPTVIKGRNKIYVIQLVVDILNKDQIIQIIRNEKALDRIGRLARNVIRLVPIKWIVQIMKKLKIIDKFSTNVVLGKTPVVLLRKEDLHEAGITSPKDFVDMFKLGWSMFVILDEDNGLVRICSSRAAKCFEIPLKSVDKIIKTPVVDATSFTSMKTTAMSVGLAKSLT